jgi:hypothetical protein
MQKALHAAAILSVTLLGCSTTSSNPSPATETSAATQEKKAWETMTVEEKGHVMKTVVMPKARELFSAFNPEKYADVKCSLCHGPNPKEVNFKMPGPSLPKFEMSMFEDDPKEAKFMAEKILPFIAEALGKKPYNPADGSGDAKCTLCHGLE